MNKSLTNYQRLNFAAQSARGMIINQTSLLEKHIEQIIAEYFCYPDKQGELLTVVLGTKNFPFEPKKNILLHVIENAHPQFNVDNPGLNKDLTKIMEERNKFAHCVLDTTQNGLLDFENNKVIGFLKYNKDVIVMKYTQDQIEALHSSIIDYVEKFRILLNIK